MKKRQIKSILAVQIQTRTFQLIALLAVFFGGTAVVLGIQHIVNQRRVLRDAKSTARRIATEQAGIISARLEKLTPVAERIAEDLSSGALKARDVQAQMKQALEENPDLFEVGLAYLPFAKRPGVRLFAPHVSRSGASISEFQLEERYDYTSHAWFRDGIAAGSPHWGEPYFGGTTKTLVVGYTVPFYRNSPTGRTLLGVVRINLSLDRIHRIISSLGLGQTGYAFLLSRKGVYLSDPVEDYMREQRTILDVARERDDAGRMRLAARALAGQPGEDEGRSGVTGQETLMFTEPIPLSGWSFGTVFMKREMLLEPHILRRSLIRIECCVMMFLLLLSILWFRMDNDTDRSLWHCAVAISGIALAGIASIWWLTLHYPDRNGEVGVHIYDSANLQKVLANAKTPEDAGLQQQVKTGIFIRTMRFGTTNDVVVTGTMWQRYDGDLKEFTPGFIIPNAEALEVKETYRVKEDDHNVIGWDFKATLREPFEGAIKYPFDRAMVRIRIAPKGGDRNIVLVPDLESYQLLVPTSLPGTDKTLILPGWNLISTYFIYSPVDAGNKFGIKTALEQVKRQELGFTIIAQRNFLDPFVSSVLPIIVVASLLFGMLIIGSKQSDKIAATGFKATDVLRASVSLLFPVLVAQVNLRGKIGSSTIIYIEYFYFVLYTAILGVSANALLFTLKGHGVSNYRDNIIPKLIFWPSLLGAFFSLTVIFLY
jgi:Cache domain